LPIENEDAGQVTTMPQYDFGIAYARMTVSEILAEKAARNGERPALTFLPDGRSFSYAELDLVTNAYANRLLSKGIGKGAHVAVMMANSPEMLFAILALGKLGAVTVPINIAARGQLLGYYLDHGEVSAMIVDAEIAGQVDEVRGLAPRLSQIITDVAELGNGSTEAPAIAVAASDLAFLMFTSGTTGPSKANMLAQSTAWSWGMSTANSYGYRSQDRTHVCLPLFHAAALQCQSYASLMADAHILLTDRFSVSNFWHEVRSSRATIIALLGSMANYIWNQPPSPDDAENCVRICNISPMPAFGRELEARFGLRVASSYSLTDYAMSTIFSPHDPALKFGSAGRPRGGIELRIVDDQDQPVAIGEVGEIVLRSANPGGTSLGYYKMPEATLAAWKNLWFHTGDRGRLDADGYLWFVDRKKDAIRRKGENISAFEVERIIDGHAAVMQSAVYAAPSEHAEDEVAVSVVLNRGATLPPEALIAHCERNMARFMIPRFIEFRDTLPMNSSLKVEKFKLREHVALSPGSFWDRERTKP
jgi:crotonobetaine/carnitine-CoA ligase